MLLAELMKVVIGINLAHVFDDMMGMSRSGRWRGAELGYKDGHRISVLVDKEEEFLPRYTTRYSHSQ
jgi:hypothetical protein